MIDETKHYSTAELEKRGITVGPSTPRRLRDQPRALTKSDERELVAAEAKRERKNARRLRETAGVVQRNTVRRSAPRTPASQRGNPGSTPGPCRFSESTEEG